MEAVGVRGDAAHGAIRHRAANHLIVLAAPDIGPFDIEFDGFFERDMRHFPAPCAQAPRPAHRIPAETFSERSVRPDSARP